jgi:hypothetical protein
MFFSKVIRRSYGTLTVWRWASNVTAAQDGPEVNSLPVTVVGTVATVIAVAASMFPLKVGAPRVAELPTTQKTFFSWAPLARRTFPVPVVVKVLLGIKKIQTASLLPRASRVIGVLIAIEDPDR